MRYFVPDLRLAVQLDEQVAYQDKFGGLPWGLPLDLWPICRQCQWPMALLAQLQHHKLRLDLGKAGRVLLLFQCNNPAVCETWDAFSGANSSFVLEPQDLGEGLTPCPLSEVEIEIEARVVDWLEREDPIPETDRPKFYTDEGLYSLPETVLTSVPGLTKLGSVPCWLQSPEEAEPSWRFLGQLDCNYHFFGPVPEPDELGCPVTKTVAGKYVRLSPMRSKPGAPRSVMENHEATIESAWTCDSANFGDGGIGYLWIEELVADIDVPKCYFFWQG